MLAGLGQVSHVEVCGSHSAGMRQPELSGTAGVGLELGRPKSGQGFPGGGHQSIPFLARQQQVECRRGITNVLGVGAANDRHNPSRVS